MAFPEPGIIETFALLIIFLALDLLPIFSMHSAVGPMKIILHSSHILANLLFSDKKPNPG